MHYVCADKTSPIAKNMFRSFSFVPMPSFYNLLWDFVSTSSGGTGETPSRLSRNFWQNAHYSRAAEPLSALSLLDGPLEALLACGSYFEWKT
jgi:hypothetical protein